jgi:cytochrome c oxidase assembly factor CtaG
MTGMSNLPPLTWGTFFSTWDLPIGWSIVCAVGLAAYLWAWRRAGAATTVRPWRVASFVLGLVITWVGIASAIGGYSMALFWMHMVLHLTLITVAPAFLVVGHPLSVLAEALGPPQRERFLRGLRSRPVGVLTHPLTGLAAYAATIVGTHLTGFMDQMARHSGLMVGEQVLYLAVGYLYLLPLVGEEPLRRDLSYGGRMLLLVAGMIPDTIVGIVLLQTNDNPFRVFAGMRPAWAPSALDDLQTAGGLMWAEGDGLMMTLAVAVMVAAITTEKRRERLVGPWLQGVRRTTLAGHAQGQGRGDEAPLAPDVDPDSDEALEAYNRMLAGLNRRQR